MDAVTGTCILDNGLFLRRMAYAETRDGTNAGTYRAGYNGGIWNVSTVFSLISTLREYIFFAFFEVL